MRAFRGMEWGGGANGEEFRTTFALVLASFEHYFQLHLEQMYKILVTCWSLAL